MEWDRKCCAYFWHWENIQYEKGNVAKLILKLCDMHACMKNR